MAARNGVSLNWGGLDRALETAGRGLESRRLALMEVVGDTLLSGTHERFDAEEDPEGKNGSPRHGHARKAARRWMTAARFVTPWITLHCRTESWWAAIFLTHAFIRKVAKHPRTLSGPNARRRWLSEESCGRRSIIRDRTFRPVRTLAFLKKIWTRFARSWPIS